VIGLKFAFALRFTYVTMEMMVAGHGHLAVGGFPKPAAAASVLPLVIVLFLAALFAYMRCRRARAVSVETQTDSASRPDTCMYITSYGEKYHCDQHCKGLRTRTTALRTYAPCAICCGGHERDVSSFASSARQRSGNATGGV